jgi:hypothetical protein
VVDGSEVINIGMELEIMILGKALNCKFGHGYNPVVFSVFLY